MKKSKATFWLVVNALRWPFRGRDSRRVESTVPLSASVRLDAMKHLQTLRELSGFAMLAVIGVAALWLCRLVVANAFAFVLFFVPAMVAGALLVVGIIGMIWSVGDWLLSALKARYYNKI